jgi:hypothetical protein
MAPTYGLYIAVPFCPVTFLSPPHLALDSPGTASASQGNQQWAPAPRHVVLCLIVCFAPDPCHARLHTVKDTYEGRTDILRTTKVPPDDMTSESHTETRTALCAQPKFPISRAMSPRRDLLLWQVMQLHNQTLTDIRNKGLRFLS